MTVNLRVKRPDPLLRQLVKALETYAAAHPAAEIEAYRHNSVSVRIRVLDSAFAGLSRAEREEEVWAALNELSDDAVSEISLLILLTPDEAKESFASHDFDNPLPSRLRTPATYSVPST
ncbi:MAG: hypothetical protein WD066_00965 [Planctomycetaceae bacterium]